MMPLADLFVHVYVLVDDALGSGAVAIPRRPAAAGVQRRRGAHRSPDADLLARPSERGFLAEVRRDWAAYFPVLPPQSEFNRRVRWLWGAFELLRQAVLQDVPADPW